MNLTIGAVPALAAAAVLCLSSSALAQEQASPPAAGAAAHHGGDHAEWRKAHEARRAKLLHDILNLRPDQEAAFQAFQTDMSPRRPEHKEWAEHKAGEHGAGERGMGGEQALTTPERLDRMAAFMSKRMAERQAAFQHRADAIKRFYAVLSPEQKRAFDALHAMRGGLGGAHGGEGPHGEGQGDRHEGGPGGHPGWGGDHEHGEAGEAE